MRQINRCHNSKIAEICQQAALLETITDMLRLYLPETMRQHCYAGSFKSGCLVVVVSDPSWASMLRFELPALRDRLRKEAGLYQLVSLKLKVETLQKKYTRSLPKPIPISSKSRDVIKSGAALCEYEPLKLILTRLGERR